MYFFNIFYIIYDLLNIVIILLVISLFIINLEIMLICLKNTIFLY